MTKKELQGDCRYCHRPVRGNCVSGTAHGRAFVAHGKCAASGIKGASPRGWRGPIGDPIRAAKKTPQSEPQSDLRRFLRNNLRIKHVVARSGVADDGSRDDWLVLELRDEAGNWEEFNRDALRL